MNESYKGHGNFNKKKWGGVEKGGKEKEKKTAINYAVRFQFFFYNYLISSFHYLLI